MKEQIKNQEETQEKKTKWQSFKEILRFAFIALIIVVPIRAFVAEPFIVSGSSMVPTFLNGDYLIIDKISYELGDPKRDDVVVFRYPGDTTKFFIKRVIGLPNETVDINGNNVTITNNESQKSFNLDQPFVKNISNDEKHIVLKSDEYFVMGDNRSASSDSRAWGPVKRELFTGRAFLRLLPINKINLLPGNYKQAENVTLQ
ncbi:MAG: signal peptidase I [Candidatus Paceibacterota bacterium]|jgi:signal peptidase I